MKTLDFYFDYRSPFLALSQVRKGCADRLSFVRENETGGKRANEHTCAPKGRYVMTDLQRWADHASRQLRATLAGKMDAMTAAVEAIVNAIWLAPAPLATAGEVAAELGAAGPDADALKRGMKETAAQVLLEEVTAKAASRGVFSAATLFVEDEMFFGNDRLHFVQDHLARAA